MAQPLRYYDNNVGGSLVLFETMAEFGVKRLVFSSSATVYGDPHAVPISEDFPLQAMNSYGRSKLMIEDILRDLAVADAEWRVAFSISGARLWLRRRPSVAMISWVSPEK